MTHCGNALAEKLIREASKVLADTGKFLFSIVEDSVPTTSPSATGWIYPNCVAFGPARIDEMCATAGLVCRRLPWYHPGAVWYVAAHQVANLPSDREMPLLQGAVLFDPQFQHSRSSTSLDNEQKT